MISRELNALMMKNFPCLKEKYVEEITWQEGEDTGSHIIYGDVFTPYLKKCIEEKKKDDIVCIFLFLESVLELDDQYANEVISFSVFESIVHLLKTEKDIYNLLGLKSKKIVEELV